MKGFLCKYNYNSCKILNNYHFVSETCSFSVKIINLNTGWIYTLAYTKFLKKNSYEIKYFHKYLNTIYCDTSFCNGKKCDTYSVKNWYGIKETLESH
jgi:hypothetical protein